LTVIPKPVIHPMAAQHLRELRERWGAEPTLEESLWIVRLCERALDPAGDRRDLIGIPVRVGASGEWLWPLTVGASVWWNDLASVWFGGDGKMLFLSYAFALANGRDRQTMQACRTRREAERVIREWLLGLSCGLGELEAAMEEVSPPNRPGEKQPAPKKTDWAQVCGEIETATGIPCGHWVWDISKAETERAWIRARALSAAMAGVAAPPCESPEDEAFRDLAAAKLAIVEAHKNGGAQP